MEETVHDLRQMLVDIQIKNQNADLKVPEPVESPFREQQSSRDSVSSPLDSSISSFVYYNLNEKEQKKERTDYISRTEKQHQSILHRSSSSSSSTMIPNEELKHRSLDALHQLINHQRKTSGIKMESEDELKEKTHNEQDRNENMKPKEVDAKPSKVKKGEDKNDLKKDSSVQVVERGRDCETQTIEISNIAVQTIETEIARPTFEADRHEVDSILEILDNSTQINMDILNQLKTNINPKKRRGDYKIKSNTQNHAAIRKSLTKKRQKSFDTVSEYSDSSMISSITDIVHEMEQKKHSMMTERKEEREERIGSTSLDNALDRIIKQLNVL
jgi:hypothetical protein